ncbi:MULTISPECIES: DUF4185 domain-containing protein [unclassified Mycobacterium]|uniref:DUF4185 domain-containing protein n=1 Tax=unclassified Mycobacterium TaxID=2642494 RepID=UPI0029C944B4|nr:MULTISPECIES: DUF4185 domain-containing protein [unclassified Mycobacterium]
MVPQYLPAQRQDALRRLQSGESPAAVSRTTGISRSTLARWRAAERASAADPAPAAPDGKVADITGPGISDRWGVTATDLGACVVAPNGKLVAVFGDTFSGNRVGEGTWRSPVVLIGTGDAQHPISWERAGGENPDFAEQLWFYVHDSTGPRWTQGGISTVLPSDLLRVGDTLYLHVMVNRGFPEVIWTELWRSDDSGISWQHMGEQAKFPAALHNGFAQCWSWDYDPDDGWVYVVSTGFKRDKGIILRRVRPTDIGDRSKYSGWGFAAGRWAWDNEPTPITPPGETWGELSFRRLAKGSWILGGFLSSKYALGYRTVDGPTANMYTAPVQLPVTGSGWNDEDHSANRVAQLYGGYVLPGSRLDVAGGAGLVVSQWKTDSGWPYRAMQFRSTLKDTTRGPGRDPADPINL